MQFRKLCLEGPELSVLGLGTWAIGGPWQWGWGPQDDHDSIKAIRASFDSGINWLDTAPVYGFGHSEKIVGKAIKEIRKDVFIATKCGLVWDNHKKVRRHLGAESIRREVEDSLTRLQTDYIDLYQHHWMDDNTSVNESWGELIKLRKEGKVRYIGVCNYDVANLNKCIKLSPVDSLQPPYSLLDRGIEEELLPWCMKNNAGVLAYSPLQNGLLTGKFRLENLAADDWRRKSTFFKEPQFSQNMALVKGLSQIASRFGMTTAQLALAWIIHKAPNTFALVGARNEKQANENASAGTVTIDEDLMREIEAL
ncbi:MAG: aldo/keto reductase [Deferribacteres bacterium]|nr:aldo/keto reductase [candidate division KSB1 bacterium]MCB9502356.1 aldo/keto reductase [Deferribacteres bacterium]